jgi:hypothetical protein
MATINLTCPQCGQIFSVRKASAIVSDGTASSTYSGYGDGIGYSAYEMIVTDEAITITGSSQTQLSWLLSPPIKPHANYFDEFTLIMVIAGVIGLFVAVFGLIQILLSQFATGIFLLLFGSICFGICVWIAVRFPDLNKNNEIRFKDGSFFTTVIVAMECICLA